MMKRKWYCLSFVLAVAWGFTDIAVSAPVRPTTVAELALYRGADRQQILEEGAKKEGKLMYYTSGMVAGSSVVDAFQKRYPYIKVEIWRAGAATLVPRILEEYKVGKLLADVVESTNTLHFLLQKEGISQPFYSPSLAYIEEDAITKAPDGSALAAAFREQGNSLGYNTKLLTRDQVPKTYQDLLDPKWKGKMAITGLETGWRAIGTIQEAMGENFVKKLAEQKFVVHMVAPRGVCDMVINGEYALALAIIDIHAINGRKEGAPCDWVPLEPVNTGVGQIALTKTSPHPHAAMLFIDFELSRESAEIHRRIGFATTRKDVPGAATYYKKFYGPRSLEESLKWEELFSRLFLKK